MIDICIYPGTFDPITKGHIDIIDRASKLCDKLIIAIYDNKDKNCMFSLSERTQMLQDSISSKKYTNITIQSFDTLLVDLAIKNNTTNIIRGIRNANDFEYEQNLFQVNRTLFDKFETIFLIAKNDNKHISSSVVRELIKLDGDYSSFVENEVLEFI